MAPAPSAGKRVRACHDWFKFVSHWLRKWREFCQPITESSKAKAKLLSTLLAVFGIQLENAQSKTQQ